MRQKTLRPQHDSEVLGGYFFLRCFPYCIRRFLAPYRLYEAPFVAHLYIHKGWYLLVLPDNFFWLLANRSQGRQDILKLLHHSCRIPRIE